MGVAVCHLSLIQFRLVNVVKNTLRFSVAAKWCSGWRKRSPPVKSHAAVEYMLNYYQLKFKNTGRSTRLHKNWSSQCSGKNAVSTRLLVVDVFEVRNSQAAVTFIMNINRSTWWNHHNSRKSQFWNCAFEIEPDTSRNEKLQLRIWRQTKYILGIYTCIIYSVWFVIW